MPNHCAAPECDYRRGNFAGKRSLFLFPKYPEQRRCCLKSIPRADYQPSKNAKICEVHFEKRFEDSAMRPDGTILTCKRGKPKLANEAVPTRFPSLFVVFNKKGNPVKIPSNATKKTSRARSYPAEPRAKMDAVQRAREDEKRRCSKSKLLPSCNPVLPRFNCRRAGACGKQNARCMCTNPFPSMYAPIPYLTAFSETQMIRLVEPKGRYR